MEIPDSSPKSTPKINQRNKSMSEGLKSLVGNKVSKNVKFMGQDLEISKLTVSQVLEIQKLAKEAGEDEDANFNLLLLVIRSSAKGGEELTDEDFDSFPIDELSVLSNNIMLYSGVAGEEGKAKKVAT